MMRRSPQASANALPDSRTVEMGRGHKDGMIVDLAELDAEIAGLVHDLAAAPTCAEQERVRSGLRALGQRIGGEVDRLKHRVGEIDERQREILRAHELDESKLDYYRRHGLPTPRRVRTRAPHRSRRTTARRRGGHPRRRRATTSRDDGSGSDGEPGEAGPPNDGGRR